MITLLNVSLENGKKLCGTSAQWWIVWKREMSWSGSKSFFTFTNPFYYNTLIFLFFPALQLFFTSLRAYFISEFFALIRMILKVFKLCFTSIHCVYTFSSLFFHICNDFSLFLNISFFHFFLCVFKIIIVFSTFCRTLWLSFSLLLLIFKRYTHHLRQVALHSRPGLDPSTCSLRSRVTFNTPGETTVVQLLFM